MNQNHAARKTKAPLNAAHRQQVILGLHHPTMLTKSNYK
jgi:hypothetical protein